MNCKTLISIISFAAFLHLPFAAQANIEITAVTQISTGNCDGMIDITASGPTGNGIYPCTFEWTGPVGFIPPPTSQEDLTGLCIPGIYVVKITFADGSCFVTLSINLMMCGADFKPNLYFTPSCTALNNGTATVLNPIPGGVSPYSYSWSNGASTKKIENLPPSGQYCVTVTDANGCKSQPACITMVEVQPIGSVSIQASPPSPNCFGGPGKLKANVPIVPPPNWSDLPTYHWSTGDWGDEIYVSVIENYDYYSVTVTSSYCPGTATAGKFYVNYRPMEIELTESNPCGFPTDIFTSGGFKFQMQQILEFSHRLT
ncbi:MAG: SprB repeat-containing protein [Saprospiraceae bacterium]